MTKSRNIQAPRLKISDEQLSIIMRMFPDTPARNIAGLTGLPAWKIYQLADKHGVRKSTSFREGVRDHLASYSDLGKDCRFKKGMVPHNKGKKVGNHPNMMPTQFRAGARPHNALPIGTIQPDHAGVMRVKIAEPRQWCYLHRAHWEAVFGPIPKGHVVAFKDGHAANWADMANLELITRAELQRRNSIHRFPAEMKQTFRLLGKLKKAINEKQNTRSA
jgi:hypothetical protein